MTTWHCDKCSLRFGTYADFGDHWRTDHRKDPITERIVSAWQDTPRPDDFTSLPDKRLHCTRCRGNSPTKFGILGCCFWPIGD